MKKSDRIARDVEHSVSSAVENAKDWAGPRVEAAVDWAVPRLQHGIDTASPKIQEGLKSAAHNLADGVATVTPRIQDGLATLAPKIHDVVEGATPRLHEALDKATPVIANARDRVVVEYLPRLSDQIGQASEVVHRTLESAPARVDAVAQKLGDVGIVHTIQEQAQTTGHQLKAAAAEATRAVTKEKAAAPKSKNRGLLIFGVIAAAVAAGVAAWKASKPVEDPWKTPTPVGTTPVTPAPVPATSVGDALADGKHAATGVVADTGEEVADVADKAAATSGGAASAAGDSVDAAKDGTAKVATDARTAVKNIAASLNSNGTSEAEKPTDK